MADPLLFFVWNAVTVMQADICAKNGTFIRKNKYFSGNQNCFNIYLLRLTSGLTAIYLNYFRLRRPPGSPDLFEFPLNG